MARPADLYENPPLALVAMEVRFPSEASGLTLGPALQREFRDLLGDRDWVIESTVQNEFEMAIRDGQPAPPRVRTSSAPRFTTRDRTTAVTAAPKSLTVETTEYHGFPGYRTLLESVFMAVSRTSPPDGISRVGLRYIDEIRLGADWDDMPEGWRGWIHDHLMAPPMPASGFEEASVVSWSGTAQYAFPNNRFLVMRYGPGHGYAISPTGPLRRTRRTSPGPFYRMDFDSYWEPDELPPFDPRTLLGICDTLHEPTSHMFEAAITDRLRSDVFKRRGQNG